jgi:hypothetical protein
MPEIGPFGSGGGASPKRRPYLISAAAQINARFRKQTLFGVHTPYLGTRNIDVPPGR